MIFHKRRFHNYFARNAIRSFLKRDEINYSDLHKGVYIGKSTYDGVGIFSANEILKGEVIEICPMVKIQNEYIPPNLVNCLFEKEKEGLNSQIVKVMTKKETTKHKLMPLGYGMLYNHSDTPNAFVHIIPINKELVTTPMETVISGEIMVLRAGRNIHTGEEICISYGQSWWEVSS
ncbi:histone-lysine N-methyltransferase, putative [Plasmodium ovale wallikeri]|uniref:Histone-lysine N-methyltransferase, putative n=1 Tax=Plasmodium ovale wallikeri TaxID=864142 RepID=A0A1A8ZX71_PLAOA|nr:histone-lysine N-methyltransferase, putative [Plasmodium ovale wallikeri]SBT48889.1 histone-lysine N-methyltransferase, putative [Plasmodium ovale wallikeri]